MPDIFPGQKVYIKILDSFINQDMVNHSTSRKKSEMPIRSDTNERLLKTTEPVNDIFNGFPYLTTKEAIVELANVNWGYNTDDTVVFGNGSMTEIEEVATSNVTFKGLTKKLVVFADTLTAEAIWEISRISQRNIGKVTELASGGTFDQKWDDRHTLFPAVPMVNKTSLILDAVDEYIDCGNDESLNFERTDPFSVSIWVKPEALGFRIIFSKWATSVGYNLQFTNTRKLRMTLAASGGNQILVESSVLLALSAWAHIVVTWDGSSNSSGLKYYFQSVLDPSPSALVDNLSATIKTASSFIMGKRDATQFFSGNLNQAAVFNKELSQSEIDLIYNAGKPASYEGFAFYSDLVSWWHLGGSDFPTITDQIASNDGTATNMEAADVVEDTP